MSLALGPWPLPFRQSSLMTVSKVIPPGHPRRPPAMASPRTPPHLRIARDGKMFFSSRALLSFEIHFSEVGLLILPQTKYTYLTCTLIKYVASNTHFIYISQCLLINTYKKQALS